MGSIHQTQVSLDGLLQVLGKNLYSSPSVALRELIQNAHDACERYRIETGESKPFEVTLRVDSSNSVLEISDNGSGLSHDEIHCYLATVGSGYTRILRNSTQTEDMIGYFGLGFLSAYVVSNKVEVVTTSYHQTDETWLFSSQGGKTFSLKQVERQAVGTTVRLFLSDEFTSLADAAVVCALVRKYCGLLDIPIYLDGNPERLNDITPPWKFDKDISPIQKRKKTLEFAQVFENDYEPICTIPIPSDNPYGLNGVVWVQDGTNYASSDNRNVSIFIRSMFITKDELDLLPPWAGFFGAVFESTRFLPTASRESLQRDSYFNEVALYIKEQIILGLRDIVLREPETWRRVLIRHSQALLGAALSDERLFSVCCKQLKVPTNLGEMTLPQVLKKSQGAIYIASSHERGYEEILFRSRLIPVVSGYLYAAQEFCQKFSEIESVPIKVLGSKSDEYDIFPRLTDVEEVVDVLAPIFAREKEELIITRFEPSFIPIIVIEDDDVKIKKRIESDEADKRIGAAALSLARLHTKTVNNTYERRVYINIDNDVIQCLMTIDQGARESTSRILRSFFDAINVTPEATDSFAETMENFNRSVIELIGQE